MVSIKKPTTAINTDDVLAFATGNNKKPSQTVQTYTVSSTPKRKVRGGKSGQVAPGQTRLVANIPTELHTKLKVKAAAEGRSIVDILEEMLEIHLR